MTKKGGNEKGGKSGSMLCVSKIKPLFLRPRCHSARNWLGVHSVSLSVETIIAEFKYYTLLRDALCIGTKILFF